MKQTTFRKYLLFLLVPLVFAAGCTTTGTDNPEEPNALILYLVANNNLSSYIRNNITGQMGVLKGVGSDFPKNHSIYIYWDGSDKTELTKVIPPKKKGEPATQEVVKTYGNQNSVDPEVMKAVLNDIKAEAKAENYSIILGSHGKGWFPPEMRPDTQKSPAYLPAVTEHDFTIPEGGMLTRSFGPDGSNGYMSITDLAEGLSGIYFDYILLDACFMASVEALWELRNSADYIMASPVEIMGDGFPYSHIIPVLCDKNENISVKNRICKAGEIFVDFYMGQSGYSRSAAITVVDTGNLPALADRVKDIFAGPLKDFDLGKIQYFELVYPNHAFFDLSDYLYNICDDVSLFAGFEQALHDVVLFEKHTPDVFSAYQQNTFRMERVCGLSSYIPRANLPATRAAYYRTAWAEYTQPGGWPY